MAETDSGRWRSIAGELRDRILGGPDTPPGHHLAPGDDLPTETELAAQYGTTRNTVRRALEALENEGLIRRGRPRPAVVTDRARLHDLPGGGPSTEPGAVTAAMEPPPGDVAALLTPQPAAAPAAVLVRRIVLTTPSGAPYGVVAAHYPPDPAAASPLAVPGPDPGPAVDLAALAALGIRPVRWVDEITARHATSDEATALDVPAGYPVTETRTTGYDPAGRPIVHVIAVTARTTLRYERRTDP